MFYRSNQILFLALAGSVFFSAPAFARDLVVVDGPIKAKNVKCKGCVDARDIGAGAVTSSKIRSGAVGATEIQDGAVTGPKIQNGAVTNPKIGAGAVGTANIQDKSITREKLADGVLDSGGIGPGSVGTDELQDGAVTGPKIGAGAVSTNKIGDGAVTSGKLSQDLRDSIPFVGPVDVSVDCTAGERVQDALDALLPGQPATITISGTCNEAVIVVRDDVTLRGDGGQAGGVPTSVIDAGRVGDGIAVDGARRIVIDGLLIRNGSDGISARNGAAITMTDNVLESNDIRGALVSFNSTARIDNNRIRDNFGNGIHVEFNSSATIINNALSGNVEAAILVTHKSSAEIGIDFGQARGNTITGNQQQGILLADGAAAWIRANAIDGNADEGIALRRSTAELTGDNRITSNSFGIFMSQSSLVINPRGLNEDLIANNIGDGIFAVGGSSLDVGGGFVENNGDSGIDLRNNSMMVISGATIQNNTRSGVEIFSGTGVEFHQPPATITGHFNSVTAPDDRDLICVGTDSTTRGETHYAGSFGSGGSLEGIETIDATCVNVLSD